eukprot:scaffold12057_cov133-Isochrysis_galbana.AAC.3
MEWEWESIGITQISFVRAQRAEDGRERESKITATPLGRLGLRVVRVTFLRPRHRVARPLAF